MPALVPPSVTLPWWAQPRLQGNGRAELPSSPGAGVAFGVRTLPCPA